MDSEEQNSSLVDSYVDAIEMIHPDDFHLQSEINSKNHIRKLVNSKAYKRQMEAKGNGIERWNWQAYDRKEGILQKEEENKEEGLNKVEEVDIDLAQ